MEKETQKRGLTEQQNDKTMWGNTLLWQCCAVYNKLNKICKLLCINLHNYYSYECGYKILLALHIGLQTETLLQNCKFPLKLQIIRQDLSFSLSVLESLHIRFYIPLCQTVKS